MRPAINVYEDITLVILQNIPAEISFVAQVFEKIAEMGVDVDMISLSPAQSSQTSLSFTIHDDDLVKILSYTSKLENGKTLATQERYDWDHFYGKNEDNPH